MMAGITRITRDECCEYLNALFLRAFQKDPFSVICSILRVSGVQDAGWDPFEESRSAFEDLDCYVKLKDEGLSAKASWRIGLLTYCQSIEMTAPHEVIANLLRCMNGQRYHLKPFGHLGRANKKIPFSWIPPSAKTKFRALKESAATAKEAKLVELIDKIFRDDVRNAFSHSDYIITPTHFRWTEAGLPAQIPLEDLNTYLLNACDFYSAFLGMHAIWLKHIDLPKYHKWPNYEVLELLTDKEHGLFGFSLHFSNGSKATYSRTSEGTDCINIKFENDGTINFYCGLIDALEPVWKVDGKPFKQEDRSGNT